ncbi:Proline-rich receptor-like protein kinase PERK1 [Apostasia shenzhenica]|uniref:non-specific serine/threonine protein kinase n=1 Tax=Apostasia shenzhenica TaxID=1088818 RepID=A0A2I0BC52_9ASPA|nr:Proline-rich receptor-like protein kinase PERK1 [Apostasia shenzhenica]
MASSSPESLPPASPPTSSRGADAASSSAAPARRSMSPTASANTSIASSSFPETATPSPPAMSGRSAPSFGHSSGGRTPPPPPPPIFSSLVSGSISKPVIVAIAAGSLTVVLVIIVLCVCCRGRRKRSSYKSWDSYEGTQSAPLPPLKDETSGVAPQKWQLYNPPSENEVIKVTEKLSPPSPLSICPPKLPSPPPSKTPSQSTFSSSGTSGSNYSEAEGPNFAFGLSKNTFTFEELSQATDGFSGSNLLGQGGFGYVHKGLLLNGKEVAVKQLKSGSGQGEREFRAEIEIISRVHHRHLVSLVGYCISEGKRLLVYEYVRNKTLEFHLHEEDQPTMGWPTRFKIALGAAKGLAYLHEDCNPKIIHRDIKAANILLDDKFEAKVADFGLAKFASDNYTHVSTRVMGTFGYLAPEYASSGKLTDKSDVFSFGVMLLELITGRRPVDSTSSLDESLVDWARPLMARAMDDGHHGDLVDPQLGRNYNYKEMKHMIACAAACVRQSGRRRPRMSMVLRVLQGDVSLEDLNDGIHPRHSNAYDPYSSSDFNSHRYNEALKKFRKMASLSQYVSNCSSSTSEYGMTVSTSSSSEAYNTCDKQQKEVKC